jgi:hypothetical protein
MAGSFVWGGKATRIKKERWGGIGLNWLPFYDVMQQPTNIWCSWF